MSATTGATAARGPARSIAIATLAVAALDLADALIFFGLRGVSPDRVLRGIAAGLLGPAAITGGALVPALGLVLQTFIAFVVVLALFLLGRALPALRRHPIVAGMAWGLLVYCVMNFVVIPLSALPRGPLHIPVVVNGVLIHIFGVGIPAGWFALRPFARNRAAPLQASASAG